MTRSPAVAPTRSSPRRDPKAAKTRKLLKTKLKEIEWKDTRFEEAMNELKEEVKGLSIIYATGVSRNKMITYKAKNKTVEQILDDDTGLFPPWRGEYYAPSPPGGMDAQ